MANSAAYHIVSCRISHIPGTGCAGCEEESNLNRNAHTGALFPKNVIARLTLGQNDLSEYFSLLNFANPNFLGSKLDFRKNFENLIIKGRDSMASDNVKAESEKKLKELGGLVTKFIIRRTNDLLSKYCALSVWLLDPR